MTKEISRVTARGKGLIHLSRFAGNLKSKAKTSPELSVVRRSEIEIVERSEQFRESVWLNAEGAEDYAKDAENSKPGTFRIGFTLQRVP